MLSINMDRIDQIRKEVFDKMNAYNEEKARKEAEERAVKQANCQHHFTHVRGDRTIKRCFSCGLDKTVV